MSLRARLFLWVFLLFGVGFYYFVDIVLDDIQPRYREATEEPLVDTARVLAAIATAGIRDGQIDPALFRRSFRQLHGRAFEAQIYDFLKTNVDLRLYITNNLGKVIYDSDQGRAEGEDYSNWRDVYLTLRGSYGARTSPSRLDPETKVLYVAAPIKYNGEIIGVISVGKSTANSDRFIEAAQRKLIIGGISVCLVLIVFGLLLGHWLTRPIRRLTDYALAVRDESRAELPVMPPGELSDLAAAFDEMRTALEGRRYVANYVQTLTHEIKSPLSAIRGASELLEEELPASQRRHFIDNIRTESDRITRIAETLMLLTSLESRRGIETAGPVALDRIVNDAANGLGALLETRRLQLDLSELEAQTVQGDEHLIRQAVINLLQNAIDFSPPDSVISVSIRGPDDNIQLAVRDHGPGIPDYAKTKIFDRFFSLPRQPSGKKSSGLGLSLVKEIMLLHEGAVTVVSHPEGGTLATLTFRPQAK